MTFFIKSALISAENGDGRRAVAPGAEAGGRTTDDGLVPTAAAVGSDGEGLTTDDGGLTTDEGAECGSAA